MDSPNAHGLFLGQGSPAPSPPPISGVINSPSTTLGSSAQPQERKNKGLQGHPLDLAAASKPKFKRKPPEPSGAHATAPCSECGRRFWSQKALFGHMRCHPERPWRGINPPPQLRRPQQISFESPLPPVPRPRPPHGAQQRSHDVENEVAESLVMMANGSPADGAPGPVADRGAMDVLEWSRRVTSFGSHRAHGEQLPARSNVAAGLAAARNGEEEEENGISCNNIANSAPRGGISSGRGAAEGMLMMGSDHRRNLFMGAASSSGHALAKRMRGYWVDRRDVRAASSPSPIGCVPDLNFPPPLENSDSSA